MMDLHALHERAWASGKDALKEAGGKVNASLLAAAANALGSILAVQVKKLEQRIAELESQQAKAAETMRYKGRFQPSQEYRQGDCVTSDAGLWHCAVETPEKGMKPSVGRGWQQVFTDPERKR